MGSMKERISMWLYCSEISFSGDSRINPDNYVLILWVGGSFNTIVEAGEFL